MEIGKALNIEEALKIVLELAKQNVLEDCMCDDDEELKEQQYIQENAVATAEDFITNLLSILT